MIYRLPIGEIVVSTGIPSIITSNLKDGDPVNEGGDVEYDAAIDAIESLILAHAKAGVKIDSKEYIAGLEVAIETVANQFL